MKEKLIEWSSLLCAVIRLFAMSALFSAGFAWLFPSKPYLWFAPGYALAWAIDWIANLWYRRGLRDLREESNRSDHAVCRQAKKATESEFRLSDTEFCTYCKDLCLKSELHLITDINLWCEKCMLTNKINTAPEWDGHTSQDVIERLKWFLKEAR